jgi:hypothetical protein
VDKKRVKEDLLSHYSKLSKRNMGFFGKPQNNTTNKYKIVEKTRIMVGIFLLY